MKTLKLISRVHILARIYNIVLLWLGTYMYMYCINRGIMCSLSMASSLLNVRGCTSSVAVIGGKSSQKNVTVKLEFCGHVYMHAP